jgi:hypothetical protein
MHMRSTLAAFLVAIAVAACGAAPGSPSAPSATPGGPLTQAQIRYALIDRFGQHWFCDPDEYPVARGDEAQLAVQRFADVKADRDSWAAITAHVGDPGGNPTAAQKLVFYRAWKQLQSISLESVGNDRFRFDYLAVPAAGATEGTRTAGIIDSVGAITIEQQAPAGQPPCPICLARGTRIATPAGEVAVEDVRVGMEVWSLDHRGRRIAVPVRLVGSVPVPASHEVVRLELDDGRVLYASPRHQLADGRQLGDLRQGDRVDGSLVRSAVLTGYGGGATFDLLPSGPTGVYFAGGIPLGSTLKTPAANQGPTRFVAGRSR